MAFIVITKDNGEVLAASTINDAFRLDSDEATDIIASVQRIAQGRDKADEVDTTAGIYLPTGNVHIVTDSDGAHPFALSEDADEYAATFDDGRCSEEVAVSVGEVADDMIGRDEEDEDD